MEHFLECLKIIDGAVNGDRKKVLAYGEQLASNLEQAGDARSAKSVRKVIAGSKMERINPTVASALSTRSGGLSAAAAQGPLDNDSRVPLLDETHIDLHKLYTCFDEGIEERIGNFIKYIEASDALAAEGVDISPTMLLHGPPGCGKTLAAKRIAAELRLPLLTARSDGMISSYLGSTAKNIRALFEHAMSRPCVLFLDEFDAIAKLRDDKQELGELKRVVVSLLQNIDSLDGRTVIVAATNHEHLLDPAVWRRFAYKLEVSHPLEEARYKLFEHFLDRFSVNKEIKRFAIISHGLSGADIAEACAEAKRQAVMAGRKTVKPACVIREVLRFRSPELFSGEAPLAIRVRGARMLDREALSYRMLAELFQISTGQVSKLLTKDEENGGGAQAANFTSRNTGRRLQAT